MKWVKGGGERGRNLIQRCPNFATLDDSSLNECPAICKTIVKCLMVIIEPSLSSTNLITVKMVTK